MERLVLDGPWQLAPIEAFADSYDAIGTWHEQILPAHWQEHPALETHVGKVVYRKRFDWQATPGRVFLRLGGAFYRQRVRLNGRLIGQSEGYFFPHEHEITEALQAENELLIELDSPEERSCLEKEMITGVFAHWDAMSSYKYNAGGLWLPVELVVRGAVAIPRARVHLAHFDAETARVVVTAEIESQTAGSGRYQLRLTPENFTGKAHRFEGHLTLKPGRHEYTLSVELGEYALWWTHDLGEPNLYEVKLALELGEECAAWQTVTGLRTWEMRDYIGYLNGVRLYLKGSNYPPGDVRLARMDRARAAEDFRLAKAAHMNMLRVHAHVDHPALYAEADRQGVLLWQDFPMQWLYARSVLPEALRQSAEMLKLLYNHPSIVIWCMHNEPLHVDDTSVEPLLRQLKTYLSLLWSWNRDVMGTRQVKQAHALDPSRTVIRSSGEIWVPGYMAGTDGHYYFGWYMSYGKKRLFDFWRRVFKRNLRFVTEFGTQSLPNYENARLFMPDDLREADFKLLHRHNLLQWDLMNLWIDTSSMNLADLVVKSQEYQAEIQRYYVDRLRLVKYKPNGGFLNFMFQDAHPAVSWSIIDAWRQPKQSYHAYRLALAPQYAFCLTPRDRYAPGRKVKLPLYAVNDAHEAHAVRVHAAIFDPEGRTLKEIEHALTLGADCEAISLGTIAFEPTSRGKHTLALTLEREGQPPLENVYKLEVG